MLSSQVTPLVCLPFLLTLLPGICFGAEQEVLKEKEKGRSPFDAKFEKLVNDTLELWKVPGVAIAVVDGDDVWAEGYGIATYPDTKVTPSTLFFTGSTTKAFTAAALSMLIDNSSLSPPLTWTTPISSLIPSDFVLSDPYATTHVTIEDALSHRTGMPRHDLSYGGEGKGETRRDVVRRVRGLELTAELGRKFQYCNVMFVVLGYVVEVLTGEWLGDFLKRRIWVPLGMESTYFSTEDALAAPEHLAQGFVYSHSNSIYLPVPYMNLTLVSGAGSIISNVLDYTLWLKCLISSTPPLSPSDHASIRTPRTLILNPDSQTPYKGPLAYSLGWFNGVYKGYEFFEHTGGMEAFGAEVIWFPKFGKEGKGYGVVSFGNTAGSSNAVEKRVVWELIDNKLGVEREERWDWDEKNKQAQKAQEEKYLNSIKSFYPNILSPPLPVSLPLDSYTGTYTHPAYHTVTIYLQNGTLKADRHDSTWKMNLVFEHVSGEYWIVWADSSTAPGGLFKAGFAGEFKIGASGEVKEVGLAMEEEMGKEGRVWFVRET